MSWDHYGFVIYANRLQHGRCWLPAEQSEPFDRALDKSLVQASTQTPVATDASDVPAGEAHAPNAGRSGIPEGLPRMITRRSVDAALRGPDARAEAASEIRL